MNDTKYLNFTIAFIAISLLLMAGAWIYASTHPNMDLPAETERQKDDWQL